LEEKNIKKSSSKNNQYLKWGFILLLIGIFCIGTAFICIKYYRQYVKMHPKRSPYTITEAEMEIQMFNQSVIGYCGTEKSRTVAGTLIRKIIDSNNRSEHKIKVSAIDESKVSDDNYTQEHSTIIRDDAVAIMSEEDEVAVKVLHAKNARFNILYHTDDTGYVDSIEFYLRCGIFGKKTINETVIFSGDTNK